MGIEIYEPTQLNTTLVANLKADGGMTVTDILLQNILIELRVHTQYLEGIANGAVVRDDPRAMRADEVSLYPATWG